MDVNSASATVIPEQATPWTSVYSSAKRSDNMQSISPLGRLAKKSK